MQLLVLQLVSKLGIDLALIVLKNFEGVTTREDAIKALETTKTAQEYVNEDAAARGITPKPLAKPPIS